MFYIVQGIGVLAIVLTLLSFIQKEKWRMMLCLLLTNVVFIVSYLLIQNYLCVYLLLGAIARTLVYFYYSHTNRKPDTIIMVLFEIYYIVISILSWTNNPMDLFMIVNLIVVTYTSWQSDVKILRFGYVFSSLLLIPYDISNGLYTMAVSEVLMLVVTILTLIKYAKTKRNSTNVAQKYFTANKGFWGSNVISNNDYDLIISEEADRSAYYNFGIITKNQQDDVYEVINQIKKELSSRNLKEIAYIPFNSKQYNDFTSIAHTLQMFFPVEFHDVWMKLIDGFNLNNTKCKIKNIVYKEVDENNIDEIVDTYIKGYHGKYSDDELTENEKLQIKHLRQVDFKDKIENGFKTHAYLAYFNNIPVSMVCFLSNGKEGYITKVSTIPVFRRKHIASSLMQFAINQQRKAGVQEIVLVTDKYSNNEKFYAFNSFVEFGQAFAFDVTDMSKFENFINKNEIK